MNLFMTNPLICGVLVQSYVSIRINTFFSVHYLGISLKVRSTFNQTDMLLTGLCPFRGGGLELMSAKHRGEYDFDVVIPSRPAQDLVRGLLEVDVSLRFTIDQVLNHEWMIEADEYLERFNLDLAHEQLRDFFR